MQPLNTSQAVLELLLFPSSWQFLPTGTGTGASQHQCAPAGAGNTPSMSSVCHPLSEPSHTARHGSQHLDPSSHKDRADPEVSPVLPIWSQLCHVHPSPPPPRRMWPFLIISSTFPCSLARAGLEVGSTLPKAGLQRETELSQCCLHSLTPTLPAWQAWHCCSRESFVRPEKEDLSFCPLLAGRSQSVHVVKQHL